MDDELINAFDFYLKHQAELVEQYDGKFIVIKDDKVVGAFDDEPTALREMTKKYKLGSFLLQRVSPGDTAYSLTFHSRVSFAEH